MKIATWNVNSLRVRLPHILNWIEANKPDVLALQETKVPDEEFPFETFKEKGYQVIASGQKAYNGVALLSRIECSDVSNAIPDYVDPQRRVLAVSIDGVRILNLYIPNGQDTASQKYTYKMEWLNKLDDYLKNELQKYSKMIVLGDFNIAPNDIDVHNPKRWQGKIMCSELERQAFTSMLDAGFEDCFRLMAPEEQAFSWWDYRLQAFERGWGLRIDHILASKSLSLSCRKCYIDQVPRSWERPSDHAPVIAEF